MFKIKTKIYGAWVTFEDVYGSGKPALFDTIEAAEKVAKQRARMYHARYKVVPV